MNAQLENQEQEEPHEKTKILCFPFIKNTSEEIERECRRLGVKVVSKSYGTLRQVLEKLKTPREHLEKKDIVYEVPCMDCDKSYIGETGRNLKKRIVEHKYAVKRKGDKNEIAVHANNHNHKVDGEGVKVLEEEPRYWRRRTLEVIHIHRREQTSILDCGLALNDTDSTA